MSTIVKRTVLKSIKEDLKDKMVFIGGPRQVGKTTLAQSLLKKYYDKHPAYLNWDDSVSRKKILNREWPSDEKLIIFDEIHKYAKWRNLVKGHYDVLKNTHSFIVTGSARLNVFRRGGDSLLGRYHYYRLHPFSLGEVGFTNENLLRLMRFGGFPDPYLKGTDRFLKRWHKERLERIVFEDLRDLERVNDINSLEILSELLPGRVGSPLSIKSLSEDLSVDFKTAKHWIEIFERLYYCYRIAPYGAPRVRAVKKEQKLYMYDWTQVEETGFRFENLVASHLLKYCHFLEDTEGEKMELRFLRDTDKREVDFVVLKNKKPVFAVECKTGEKGLSPHIKYFKERTDIPQYYQVHMGTREASPFSNVAIMPFVKFAKKLNL
jgi:predicted AAA+ superfamily ATPase